MRESLEQFIVKEATTLLKETESYDDALLYAEDIVNDAVKKFPGPLKESIEKMVVEELKKQAMR